MPREQQLFEDSPLDPEIAKAADRYLAAKKEKQDAVDREKTQSKLFMKRLRDAGRLKIRHGNMIIELVSTPASEKIKVKETKQAPLRRGKRPKGESATA